MRNISDIPNVKNVVMGIASSPLLIDRNHALNLLFKYNALTNSVNTPKATELEIERQKASNQVRFYAVSDAQNVSVGKFVTDFEQVQKGSIAVIPVNGAMMRDSYCTLSDGFIAGTRDLERTFQALDNNDNVEAIVVQINTPGGEARGNESLSRVIKNIQKPVIGHFEGMASAGVFAFQGVNELYASERSSYWGSIGTYVTLIDDREFMKSLGVDLLEIYAPQSTEKNKEVRDALDGNLEPIESMLFDMTENFIRDVKESRPNLKDDGLVFKGKLYNAVQAKKIGAIDGIKSLDFVLNRASFLARKHKRDKKKKKTNNSTNILNENNEIIMSEQDKKLSLFERFFGSKSAEQVEKDINNAESQIETLESSIETLTTEKTELVEKQFQQETKITELTELNSSLNERIASLEKEVSEKDENLKALTDTEFNSVSELVEDYNKVKEHNKELAPVENSATPIDNQQSTTHEVSQNDLNKTRSYQDIINQMNAESSSDEK